MNGNATTSISSSAAARDFEHILQCTDSTEHVLTKLATSACSLTVADAIALGFWSSPENRSGYREINSNGALGYGLLGLEFSQSASGVALTWRAGAQDWMRFWVNGTEIPVPCNSAGRSLATEPANWCAERYFFITTVMEHHPLQDLSLDLSGTGSQHAVFLWDADQRTARVENPADNELWPLPWIQMIDDRTLYIHPNRRAPDSGVARVLHLRSSF